MSVTEFLKNLVRVSEDDEDYDYEEEEMEEEQNTPSHIEDNLVMSQPVSDRQIRAAKPKESMNKKVTVMPGVNNGNAEVMVIEPRTFDEMPQVIDALRSRKSVVLNLEMMNPQEAQRSVDFVAGGTYAMDGHYERVGESIFLFTPSCVVVSSLSGLLSEADDFSAIRSRRQTNRPTERPGDMWQDDAAMAH